MSKKKYTLDKAALSLLNEAYKNGTELARKDLAVAQNFLQSAIGNLNLNRILRADKSNALGIYYTFKNNLIYLSYKTRNVNLDEDETILDKMSRAQKASQAGKPIADEDKVTLKEFAIISDVAKTANFLGILDRVGLVAGNKKLEQLYKIANRGQRLINHLEANLQAELPTVGPGTIVFNDTDKTSSLKRVAVGFFDEIFRRFTKYEHTSVLHVERGQAVTSEITHEHTPKSFDVDITDYLKSDMYKIDIIALIPKEQHELMEATYGKGWKEVITTKYKLIENDIHGSHTQSRLGDLRAASGGGIKQVKAGLANLIPFGHKQVKKNDFEEIHHKVMSNHYATHDHPKMLCSEFSARTTIAALVELNKQTKKDIGTKKDALGMTRAVPKTVVKIPFGKHENLFKLHPQRLFYVLNKHGCIEKVQVGTDKYFKVEAVRHGKRVQKHIVKTPNKKHIVKPNTWHRSAKAKPSKGLSK